MRARPWGARRRLRLSKRFKRDAVFFAAAFAALFGIGFLYSHWAAIRLAMPGDAAFAVALGAVLIATGAFWRTAWHLFANRFFLGAPRPLRQPWVVDGDTIDDLHSGVRYRLANIDAPETESTCYKEAARAQLAKWTLVRMVREARFVAARPTFRVDGFGRRVAFLLIDGADAGEMLMARGFAVPWRGWRKRWCGPGGGLAKIARTGAMPHQCKTCGAL